ncbi:MAG TPA: site-2 protease family protein [Terriglobales bacterium]
MDQLSSQARALEQEGKFPEARQRWQQGLTLLPRQSKQADWIRNHSRSLEIQINATEAAKEPENKWVKKLAPLGPVAVILAKAKGFLLALFKLKFLLSLTAFIAIYWAEFGAPFGIGFAALILIHEMGHYIDIKRRGLPAEMPVFLPGLGAYVRWQALGVPLETRAAISLAGPFAGWLASIVCALVWMHTGSPLWAALARSSAWLNALNLIPVWILDGGQAALALSKAQRFIILTAALALWLLLGEGVFFLVAAGAGWRLFTKDAPEKPSTYIAIYYLSLLVLLGVLIHMLPGKGFAR